MSRTAFRPEDVLLLQMTRLRPQPSGGQRSPRAGSTSSTDVVAGPERLVVPYVDLMGRFRTDDAPALIRAARLDAGLSRVQLAQRAGLNESVLTQVESGARAVSDELLEAVLRAAGYRPSLPLAMQADKILACAESHGLSNLRVFGSSVRGEDDVDSDIDLLVTPSTSTDLFDLALFVDDVERLTGFPADVVSDSPYLFSWLALHERRCRCERGASTGSLDPAHQDVAQQAQRRQGKERDDVGPVQAARDNEPGKDDSDGPQQPDARRRQAALTRTRVLGLQQDEAEQEHAQR